MNIKNNKFFLGLLILIFVFVFNLEFFIPDKVYAQNVDPVQAALQNSKWTLEKIWKTTKDVWNKVGSVAFTNAVKGFTTSLAKDSANYFAQGSAGRKSLIQKKPWATYFKDAGKAAAAQFADDLLSGVSNIDICNPPTIGLNFNIAMSMKTAQVTNNKPRCSLDEIGKKWGDWGKALTRDPLQLATLNGQSLKDIAEAFGINTKAGNLTESEEAQLRTAVLARSFSFKGSDMEYVNDVKTQMGDKVANEEKKVTLESAGFKEIMGSKTVITGELKTPTLYSEQQLSKLNPPEESFIQRTENIAVDTLNIFASTFIKARLERFIREELAKSEPPQRDINPGNDSLIGFNTKTKSIIDEVFSAINKISLNINPRNIDVISEMEMDLGDEFTPKVNNGTIDSRFAEALRKSETEPITLQEAIDNDYIDSGKFFGFTDIGGSSLQQSSKDAVITYDNIKKLRKNRVVPVGWEFAALQIEELAKNKTFPSGCNSKGCTLQTLIDGYSKSGSFKVGDTAIYDSYCGWRRAESYLSYSELNDPTNPGSSTGCNNTYFNIKKPESISGLRYKTESAHCYQYTTDSNGVVTSREDKINSYPTKSQCENGISSTSYREWVDGGCFVMEENESPFCHLVDPDWIIKAPEQQCNLEGYYSALESSDSSNRYKDCADVKNCLKQDDKGNCLGYGYCLKEKNIWRFRGDNCSEKFATCKTLKDDMGATKSYLVDTLKNCYENEAGCKSYSIYQTQNSTNAFTWNESYDTNQYKTIYLNKNSKTCDKNSDGCSKFIELKPGANLVPNGSFEIDEDNNDTPEGWMGRGFVYSTTSIDGAHSIKLSNGSFEMDVSKLSFNILNKGLYTLSYYAKKASSNVQVTPQLVYGFEGDPRGVVETNSDAVFTSNNSEDSMEWVRKTGYFSVNNPSNKNLVGAKLKFVATGDVYIDAVQFEINKYLNSDIATGVGEASQYNDYAQVGSVYFKKAPEYYGCDPYNRDSAECAPYLKYCDKKDNGCEAYRPTNSDPVVPAIPEQNDLCPGECNNYQTFSQNPSYFEKIEWDQNNSDIGRVLEPEDKNFIPETAKDCPANQESCELFTNIDKLEKGAEAREYYSFLRQCVKPSEAQTTIYYTWEGSDTSGFQLKTWRLLQGEKGAPCTNVTIGGNTCNDRNTQECNPETNLDCRVFYDKNAVSYNRLLSKTVPVTDDCIDLRRENSTDRQVYKAMPSLSKTCSSANAGCRKYKGNKSDNVRNVFTEAFESGTTISWSSQNSSLELTKEAVAYNGHSLLVRASQDAKLTYNITSSGHLINPNKYYTLTFWAKKHTVEDDNTSVTKSISNTFAKAIQSVRNIFYKKAVADSNNDIGIDFLNVNSGASVVVNSSDWIMYKYDAVLVGEAINNGNYVLNFTVDIPSDANGFYIDNIILKEITGDFYKIKDSWKTPNSCTDGNYLGCQKYLDKNNEAWYFYKFSNLCKEENIGCTAMIDTKNSSMPYEQTFNAYCKDSSNPNECKFGSYYYKNYSDIIPNNRVSSTMKIAQDELVYVIKDTKYLCNGSSKGCSKMGFLGDNSQYSDIYKINDPDSYITDDFYGGSDQTLCLSENKDCVGFSGSDGGMIYKIHPRNKTCEYREKDTTRNMEAGFYKVGTDESCDNLLYNENYNSFVDDINSVSDNFHPFTDNSNTYAALCPSSQDSCSLFIDPNDNIDTRDIIKQDIDQDINFNTANSSDNWILAKWNNSSSGSFAHQNDSSSVTALSGGGINIGMSTANDSIVYTKDVSSGHDTLINPKSVSNIGYDFSVNSGELYSLSANVKMDGTTSNNIKDYITTFLSCKPGDYRSLNSGYMNSNNVPYAFPSIKSNYSFEEISGDTSWHNIYGIYKITNGAKYCNVVFSFHGNPNSSISLKDIKFEKIGGTYYYKDNNSLDRTTCTRANLKEGCVLFNNTSKGALTSNSSQSYAQGRLIGNDSQYANNANDLLKVVRDRECGEWATCGSQIKTKDPQTGGDKYSCTSLVACNKLSETQTGECDNYVTRDDSDKPLTLDYYYKAIGKSAWGDLNYSGYSIPGLYPIDSLESFKVSSTDYMLGHGVSKRSGNTIYAYKSGIGVKNPLYSTDYVLDNYNNKDTIAEKSCRLYPEKDSPFTKTQYNGFADFTNITSSDDNIYATIGSKSNKYQNANMCQPSDIIGASNTCDCSYATANYGTDNLYYPYDYANYPSQILVSNDFENSTPTYAKLKKVTRNLGLRGYCLDYDKSFFIGGEAQGSYQDPDSVNYRCSMWYPVDSISGELDSTTYAPEADVTYDISPSAKMCMGVRTYSIPEDRVYCAYYSASENEANANLFQPENGGAKCNVLAFIPKGTTVSSTYLIANENNGSSLLQFIEGAGSFMKTGDFQTQTLNNGSGKQYNIIYGKDWESWYASEVFNHSCDFNNAFDSAGNEKELKFSDDKFGNYYNSFSKDSDGNVNLINQFKSLFSNVDFYFYDEGVDPSGKTYPAPDATHKVYGWGDINGQNANDLGGSADDSFYHYFVPLVGGFVTYGSNSDGCDRPSHYNNAYVDGCINAKNNFGGGHEVLTNCQGGITVSYWNKFKFNYYVHYNPNQDSSGRIANVGISYYTYSDNYRSNMSSSQTIGQGFSTCVAYADIGGTGDNRTIFKSNNYYLNSIPLGEFSSNNDCYVNGQSICPQTVYTGSVLEATSSVSIASNFRKGEIWIQGPNSFMPLNRSFGLNNGLADNLPIINKANGDMFPGSSQFPIGIWKGSDDFFNQAKSRLSTLIVKIPENNFHVRVLGSDGIPATTWSNTNYSWNNISSGYLPVVKSVNLTSTSSLEGSGGFSINNMQNDYVVTGKKSAKTDVSFYAYADANQTPIQEISICWDSSGSNCSIFTGPFKNRKHDCERRCGNTYVETFANGSNAESCTDTCSDGKACFAKSWGDTSEACIEDSSNSSNYFRFNHVYNCSPLDVHWSNDCTQYGLSNGCCIYNPKVKVTDNWGKYSEVGICGNNDNCHVIIAPR